MGKHKEKKNHKEKKHKKDKKKQKEYSSSNSSGSEDEWIEKTSADLLKSETKQRDDWLSLPTSFLSSSNKELKESHKKAKELQKQNDQYNPSTSVRELNPYWKDNGTGLPSNPAFKKPSFDDGDVYASSSKPSSTFTKKTSNWQKSKTPTNKNMPDNIVQLEDRHRAEQKYCSESEVKVLSQKELNSLGAKLVKAEIMGNIDLKNKLQMQLDNARKLRDENPEQAKQEDVILTQTDSKGYSRPLKSRTDKETVGRQKKRKVETHNDGERTKYFPDDDKYSLKEMFEHEKFNTTEKQNEEFLSILGKNVMNDDLDEIFTDKIRNKEKDGKEERRDRDRTIAEHSKMSRALENCNRCPQSDSVRKHLIISITQVAYLFLPKHEPLTDGHCLIAPTKHVVCSTQLDENEWEEIMDYRKSITRMFASKGEDVIFFEVASHLHRFPHMAIECIPIEREIGDLAPIYFKKAIDESETEWATNKKLIKLDGRNVRRAVPKGLPYFFVSFGMQEGFAHVIEDEEAFPANFAQEIIGGMLDLHHSKWRKPKHQKQQEQSDRVKQFKKTWLKFDHKIN